MWLLLAYDKETDEKLADCTSFNICVCYAEVNQKLAELGKSEKDVIYREENIGSYTND